MHSLITRTLLLGILTSSISAANPIEEGKVSLNVRTRYENVTQTGLKDASALTLRARLGFTTAPINGFKALVEFEHITALDPDSYNQAGLNPGGAGRAVIADPEHTELNQAALIYTQNATTVTLGRQRLVLDNVRFIGDVGWRQNQQTFDAFVIQDQTIENTKLTYAYLNQINRIFGDSHPAGQFDSDSHVINASYSGLPGGTLTGYGYLLDFDNAAANSCATFGVSFAGKRPLNDDLKITYRGEYASQSDYGSSPLSYTTDYLALSAGLSGKPGSISITHEVLGSDRNVGFKTPLATLHAFNGWADRFLGTPGAGLRDTYAKCAFKLPSNTSLLAVYHHYETDVGSAKLGHEWNLQAVHSFNSQFKGLIKFADFSGANPTIADVRKIWAQVEFKL